MKSIYYFAASLLIIIAQGATLPANAMAGFAGGQQPYLAVQTETTGGIEGKVYDVTNNNAPLAGVIVTVTNEETGLTRNTRTDKKGRYVLRLLPPGLYRIDFKRKGYEGNSLINFPVRPTEMCMLSSHRLAAYLKRSREARAKSDIRTRAGSASPQHQRITVSLVNRRSTASHRRAKLGVAI